MQGPQTDSNSIQVELYFNGRNLKDLDYFSKSDPFIKVFLQQSFYGNLQCIGQTEKQKDTVNPNWNKKVNANYFFQQKQPMRLQVYDSDGATQTDFIGKAYTTLGYIMGCTHQTAIIDIEDDNGKKAGKIIIRAQKLQNSSMGVTMKWKAHKLQNMDSMFDFWDKSDPYLKFLKMRNDNTFIEVARTEVIMDNQSPSWKPISIPLNRLVSSDNTFGTFRVECWDYEEKDHKHQMIGYCYMKMADIKNSKGPIQVKLENQKIKKPGKLILENIFLQPIPNFIDYLKSGLQINMVAAIDFTGSNGIPSSTSSLHYIKSQPTKYQEVLKSVWGIISNYDYDKKIPAFGFGAKPHFPNINSNVVSHCFPLNDNPHDPQIAGFDSLMNCYVNAVSNMQFAGPTFFAPILQSAFGQAKSLQGKYGYQILLILTDGQIHDMSETKNIIVQNSNLPVSIIIVGIGNADFGKMQQLDGDGGLYSSNGKKCPRDIIQFVPFNKYNNNADLLTKQLLKQIPGQVVQYFKSVGIPPKPLPPKQIP